MLNRSKRQRPAIQQQPPEMPLKAKRRVRASWHEHGVRDRPLSFISQGRFGESGLILLCHKFAVRVVRWQQGHRGSVRAMARAMATRTEVIEFAT